VTRTRSLGYFFTFKESEKSLTMDSVRNILLDQFNECERIRSLDDLFNFRESEKSLTMDSVGVFFSVNLVLRAQKRNKIIPKSTLLKNGNSIEYTFVRIVDCPDQKMGKLPPDRHDFKFQFNECERSQDRLAIFSFLEGLKRA
jgi:hypothetical protein